ncbi:MAG: recombination mediator RecR [Acidobacteria bacterium]|nr:recombination mediator RecR [Acidobacteriota bacterium]MCW5970434.1 recombination mediator RecR [Blastocatellales bacterium]
MLDYAEPVTRLIDEFKRLPGIGHKSAQRLAFHLLKSSQEDAERLADAIREVKARIIFCSTCNNLTDVDPCRFCANPARDRSIICVVEEPYNLVAIEKTREYHGAYHVLHGALSPIRGIGPEDLRIRNLLERLRPGPDGESEIREIILATNPNTEGEATANYLGRLLKPLGVRVTRIAMGLPVGSDLEYADEVTMHKALLNRHEM